MSCDKKVPKKSRLKPLGLSVIGLSKSNSLAGFVRVFRYVRCLRLPFVAHKLDFMGNLVAKAAKFDHSTFAQNSGLATALVLNLLLPLTLMSL